MRDGKPIHIVTGPVRSGKTTRLARFLEFKRAEGVTVGGVMAPLVNGERHLSLLPADDSHPPRSLTQREGETTLSIGPHLFSEAAFAWARNHIEDLLRHIHGDLVGSSGSLIAIDEVGPLELRGEALEPAVSAAIEAARSAGGPELILVVRDRLVDKVVGHYGLSDWSAILDL